jgi:hypothetical protein
MEAIQSTLTWLWSGDAFTTSSSPSGEYTPLSLPGSQYLDETPIFSLDYDHEFSIYCLHLAFTDKILISGSYETITIHELTTPQPRPLTTSTASRTTSGDSFTDPFGLGFTDSTGGHLFSTEAGSGAGGHPVATGTLIRTLTGDFDWVYALEMVYGPTPLIASAHRDCQIRLWDYFDQDLEVPIMILSGHSHAVSSLLVIQGPYPILVSSSFDTTLSVWDLSSKRRLQVLKQSQRPIRTLVYLEADFVDSLPSHPDSGTGALMTNHSLGVSKTGPYVICGNDNGTIIIWHPRSWILCKKILHPNASTSTTATGTGTGPGLPTSAIKSLACSHWNHEPRVFAGYDDGFIRLFHLHTRQQLLCFQAHENAVRAMAIVEVSFVPSTISFFSSLLCALSPVDRTSATPFDNALTTHDSHSFDNHRPL